MTVAVTEANRPVVVHVNRIVQWVLSLSAILLTSMFGWGTKEIVRLSRQFDVMDSRVSLIENTRFTAEDWIRYSSDLITQREYDATMAAIQTALARIESKLDNDRAAKQ